MKTTQAELCNGIEALVDANTLFDVAMCLSLVCVEKAEHLRCNWQDEAAAKQWERAEKALMVAVRKIQDMGI